MSSLFSSWEAGLSRFLNIQLCCCLLINVKCAEAVGGSCPDDLREVRLQDLLRENSCPNCVLDHSLDAGSEGARSFPALFVCLWLHLPCCSAKRSRVLLTQDLANQIADLPRFPQIKSLFQFRVPVDSIRDFSKKQVTTVAAQQSPGLVTAHGSFEAFCPSRGASRDHAPRECHRRGRAKLGELLVPFCEGNVPNGAVWKRAVVKWVSWGHWLRALRRLLIGGRTAGRCILMSGLSSVLFTEWGIAVAQAATVASLRSDSATYDAGCTVDTALLPNAIWEQ